MSRFIIALSLFAVLTGCAMAGPGVAQVGEAPGPGRSSPTTYNSDWANQEESELHGPNNEPHLGVDISKHELGIRNRADLAEGDDAKTTPYTPGWKKRQNARKAARKAEWKKNGGIVTIKDEEKARNEE
ncbi:MAG: hypothetical protein ACYTDT_12450 [Planctomycetota bacterium]|jgi:hypothetical protein